MSSARDITAAVRPPRAAYLDFPLGHTSGRAHAAELNRQILKDTVAAFESLAEPGSIVDLPYRWSDSDDWKEAVFAPADRNATDGIGSRGTATKSSYADDRVPRRDTPQYQCEADEARAAESHEGRSCRVCEGIDF